MTVAAKYDWPIKAGDDESLILVFSVDVSARTYAASIANANALATPLAQCTVSPAVVVGTKWEVTLSLTPIQTRAIVNGAIGSPVWDIHEVVAGKTNTIIEGRIVPSRDVTL